MALASLQRQGRVVVVAHARSLRVTQSTPRLRRYRPPPSRTILSSGCPTTYPRSTRVHRAGRSPGLRVRPPGGSHLVSYGRRIKPGERQACRLDDVSRSRFDRTSVCCAGLSASSTPISVSERYCRSPCDQEEVAPRENYAQAARLASTSLCACCASHRRSRDRREPGGNDRWPTQRGRTEHRNPIAVQPVHP